MLRVRQKYSTIILFIILTVMHTSAQIRVRDTQDPNEIHLYLGGGLSSIHHQLAPYNRLFNGYAIDFGIGHLHYFNKNWGVYLGMGAGLYNTKKNVDVDLFTPNLTDQNNYQFDLYTKIEYREAFQKMYMGLPVMLHFQTSSKNRSWRQKQRKYKNFYVMGGVKANIPFKDRYESAISKITNSAYYPEMDNWAATQKFAGLGVFNDGSSFEGNLEIEMPLLMLAFETGIKWRFKENCLLYTGIFFDYGFHNTVRNSRPSVHNDIAVDHITDFTLMTFSEKIDMINAGIIFRLALFRSPRRAYCPY